MNLVTSGPEFGNPAYEATPDLPHLQDSVADCIHYDEEGNEHHSEVTFDFTRQYGVYTVKAIFVTFSGEKPEQADVIESITEKIRTFRQFATVEFEKPMTINYNKPK